jgi:hypothetical protein
MSAVRWSYERRKNDFMFKITSNAENLKLGEFFDMILAYARRRRGNK